MPPCEVVISSVLKFSFRTFNVHAQHFITLRKLLIANDGCRFRKVHGPGTDKTFVFSYGYDEDMSFIILNGVLDYERPLDNVPLVVSFVVDRHGIAQTRMVANADVAFHSDGLPMQRVFPVGELVVRPAHVEIPIVRSPSLPRSSSSSTSSDSSDSDSGSDSGSDSVVVRDDDTPPPTLLSRVPWGAGGDCAGGADDDDDDDAGVSSSDEDDGPCSEEECEMNAPAAPPQQEEIKMDLRKHFKPQLEKRGYDVEAFLCEKLVEQHDFIVPDTALLTGRHKRARGKRANHRSIDKAFANSRGFAPYHWERWREGFTKPYGITVLHQEVDLEPALHDRRVSKWFLNACFVTQLLPYLEAVAGRMAAMSPGREQPDKLHLQIGLDGKGDTGLSVGGGKVFSVWIRFANINCLLEPQSYRRGCCIGAFAGKDKARSIRAFLHTGQFNQRLRAIERSGLTVDGVLRKVQFSLVGDLPAVRAVYTTGRLNVPFPTLGYNAEWHDTGICHPWCGCTPCVLYGPPARVRLSQATLDAQASKTSRLPISPGFCIYGFLHGAFHVVVDAIVDIGLYALKHGTKEHPLVKAIDTLWESGGLAETLRCGYVRCRPVRAPRRGRGHGRRGGRGRRGRRGGGVGRAFYERVWNPFRFEGRGPADADSTSKPPRDVDMTMLHHFAQRGGLDQLATLALRLPFWEAPTDDPAVRRPASASAFLTRVSTFYAAYQVGRPDCGAIGREVLRDWTSFLPSVAHVVVPVDPHPQPLFNNNIVAFGPADHTCLDHANVAYDCLQSLGAGGSLVAEIGEYWLEACQRVLRRTAGLFNVGRLVPQRQLGYLVTRLVELALVQPLDGPDPVDYVPPHYPAPPPGV